MLHTPLMSGTNAIHGIIVLGGMLVLADASSGSGQATVLSWGLDIQVVPEPVPVALGVFGGLFAAVQLACLLRRRKANRFGLRT